MTSGAKCGARPWLPTASTSPWPSRDDYGGDLYYYTFSSFFTVRLDGTDLRRVGLYTYGLGAADWAPNGRQLVYSNREPRADCIDGLH